MKRLIVGGVIWFGACAPALAGAPCQRSSFTFGYDTPTVHSSWRMEKNTSCSQSIHTSAGRNFSDWKILRRPAHGLAGVQGSILANSYAYQPKPGFVGKDSFSLSVKILAQPNPYILTINIDIDVVPSL